MTLRAFQHALADLVAQPNLCSELECAAERVLSAYELSPLEMRRLRAIVRHPGMSVNCSLYRVNRLEAIYTLLPLTCLVLKSSLKELVDAYWHWRPHTTLQFADEIEQFARFVHDRARRGELASEFALEVLTFELAVNELRAGQPGLVPLRLVSFIHEPMALLASLWKERRVPIGLPRGKYFLRLDGRGDELTVEVVDPQVAMAREGRGTSSRGEARRDPILPVALTRKRAASD
jgi:hypothetical protein